MSKDLKPGDLLDVRVKRPNPKRPKETMLVVDRAKLVSIDADAGEATIVWGEGGGNQQRVKLKDIRPATPAPVKKGGDAPALKA